MTNHSAKDWFTSIEISHTDGQYGMKFSNLILDNNKISAKEHDREGTFIMEGTVE